MKFAIFDAICPPRGGGGSFGAVLCGFVWFFEKIGFWENERGAEEAPFFVLNFGFLFYHGGCCFDGGLV
jgi:hypothetical protein